MIDFSLDMLDDDTEIFDTYNPCYGCSRNSAACRFCTEREGLPSPKANAIKRKELNRRRREPRKPE